MRKEKPWHGLIRIGLGLATFMTFAWLYSVWARLPITESRTLGEAYVQGAIGALACGLLLAFLVRHLVAALLISSFSILMGHAWALQHTTDVTRSFWNALESTIPELRRYHLVLVALVLTAWGVVTLLARRYLGAWWSGVRQSSSAVEQ